MSSRGLGYYNSQGSQSMNRSCTKSTKNQLYSVCSKLKYLSQFPVFLHQYINEIIDVGDDGNYVFWAIAYLLRWGKESWSLVRTQLDTKVYQHYQLYSNLFYDTLLDFKSTLQVASLGEQSHEKWMKIPNMSYHTASRYNVILVSLSKNLNITFFPLVIAQCIASSRHKIITIGFVNNNSWVQVKLKSNFQLSTVTDWWRHNCSEVARARESTYMKHIRH